MTFRGQVVNLIGLEALENGPNLDWIGDVAPHELKPGVRLDLTKIKKISGIGELVQNDDPGADANPEKVPRQVGPNKTSSAGNKDGFQSIPFNKVNDSISQTGELRATHPLGEMASKDRRRF